MPKLVEDPPKYITELGKSLKKDSKATVDVKKHANGDSDLAKNFLILAAREVGVEIDVKANKTSAIAIVKDDDEA